MLLTDHDRLRELALELDAIGRRTERPDVLAALDVAAMHIRNAVRWAYEQAEFDAGLTSVLGGPVVDLTRDLTREVA